jgi:uncharacterized membrane protein
MKVIIVIVSIIVLVFLIALGFYFREMIRYHKMKKEFKKMTGIDWSKYQIDHADYE